jgi:hypothetical protein
MRSLLLAGLVSSLLIACGSADPPLGGPYGGTVPPAAVPGPGVSPSETSGSGAGAGESSNKSSDGTGANGSTGSSAGTGSSGNTGSSTGSGSGKSTVDAGTTPPVEDAGPASASTPTWSSIYTAYLAAGTAGNCGGCHGQMSTASGSYSYLTGKHQIGGSSSALVSANTSCLSWMGGNMPPLGPSSEAAATADLQAWAAAGAQDN